jgi:hypothetical protein
MNTWVRRSLNVGALTAGALLASGAAGAAAQAGPSMTSTDNVGIGNGTQLLLPVQAPINICGNAVAVAGVAGAGCEGGSAASLDPEWGYDHYRRHSGGGPAAMPAASLRSDATTSTDRNVGILNGTQVYAPVQVPINACGNAVGVLGVAGAGCEGGAEAELGGDRPEKHYGKGKGKGKGKGHGKGHGGYEEAEHPDAEAVAASSGDATMITSGNVGVLNGTQALVPVQVPINVCGNAISVLGVAHAGCED